MFSEKETFVRRWSRRSVTITACYVLFFVLVATMPIWIPLSLALGAVRRNSFSETRAFFFVTHYVFCQVCGSFTCIIIWVFSGEIFGLGGKRFEEWMFWLEFTWGKAFGSGTLFIWGIRSEFEFDYEFTDKPVILFVRHASIADTFIPLLYVCIALDMRLRYVLKRELVWDLCIDVACNRLPHLFVERGSQDSAKEVAAIGRLVSDVGPREGVIIFPEGTRYSEAKKARILEKLEQGDGSEIRDWARKYERVLPPRMAGPLALLESNPGADAVFCAHTGLEKSSSFRESFNGGLVNTLVHVRFWGVPFEKIPEGTEARQRWLLEQWKRVDDFIIEKSEAD